MKRNLMALSAVVLAIAFSSFTAKRVSFLYLVYKGSGAQTSVSNYNSPTPNEPSDVTGGSQILNWFRVTDENDNGLSGTEFIDSFNSYDQGPTTGTLNDETEIDHELDIKNQ